MPVWNNKMAVHQGASGWVSVNSSFTWSLLLCSAYQFCSSNVWGLQHHSVYALGISIIIVFVNLGLQFKWNQLSPTNSRHTSCKNKGLHAGKWPDLITSKPDAVSTLGYRWNYTGWCYRPVVFQWQSSVNLHNWNTLEDHWNALATNKYFLQWHSSVHWGLSSSHTGLPLNYNWLRVRVMS